MTAPSTESDVQTLQRRVEQALRAARPREHVVRLLEKLLELAPEGTESARFAHRHLAELSLEENPWGAALHLRRVLQSDPDDDAAHALMGLCQALQGNFRMAVSSYRRAISLSPTNPWYSHNLGHLLDVALNVPGDAIGHLQRAWRAAPEQEEVGASLAHCLGRLGKVDEALVLARALASRHPKHKDIQALVEWLESGASAQGRKSAKQRAGALTAPSPTPIATPLATRRIPSIVSPVGIAVPKVVMEPESSSLETELGRAMTAAGCSHSQVERGQRMVRDFGEGGGITRGSMPALAAAVEYALARMDGSAARQRDIAVRHGVSVSSLATRYTALRESLRFVPRDARYVPRSGG